MRNFTIKLLFFVYLFTLEAADHHLSGLIDIRWSQTNSIKSHQFGGYGKYRYSDGGELNLAQLSTVIKSSWNDSLSSHVVLSAYAQEKETDIGLTEGYIQYRSLPSQSGYRYNLKVGVLYPQLSINNQGPGWSSPFTLTNSVINSWLAEEVRHLGINFRWDMLGRFAQRDYDVSLALDLFRHNDTTGALLAWHGWAMSSQQTLWRQSKPLPTMMVRTPGQVLENQSDDSDPFTEVDHRSGYNLVAIWKKGRDLKFQLGRYDNRATPYVIEDGQYAWHTPFDHLGIQWRLSDNFNFFFQYLKGSTKMQNWSRNNIVYNGISSAYLLGSYRKEKSRANVRLDYFDIDDRDTTANDNNHEYGHAITINYHYQPKRSWVGIIEYNRIESVRPARVDYMGELDSTEHQLQFALRYYY